MELLNHRFGNDGVSEQRYNDQVFADIYRCSGFRTKTCFENIRLSIELDYLAQNGLSLNNGQR